MKKAEKIFIIGMPGSGKSTLGKKLALAIDRPFLDLDHLIEKSQGRSVREIFADRGEDYFRQLESHTLKDIIKARSRFVLACGGGTPCFHGNIATINEAGIAIYLDVTPKTLMSRLGQEMETTVRPLLAGNQQDLSVYLDQLLAKRRTFYEQAAMKFSEGEKLEKLVVAINDYAD